jgi:hypothetical protein
VDVDVSVSRWVGEAVRMYGQRGGGDLWEGLYVWVWVWVWCQILGWCVIEC